VERRKKDKKTKRQKDKKTKAVEVRRPGPPGFIITRFKIMEEEQKEAHSTSALANMCSGGRERERENTGKGCHLVVRKHIMYIWSLFFKKIHFWHKKKCHDAFSL